MHPGINSWKKLLYFSFHYFSAPILLRTLFLPWQMDTAEGSKFTFLEKVVFAIFARVLGFVGRVFFIVLSILFFLIIFISFPVFFLAPIEISEESLMEEGSVGFTLSFGNTFFLNKHGRDTFSLSGLRIYGKEKSLRMVERALSKETKRNVLIVGNAGVGKKTLIDYIGLLATSGISFSAIRYHRVVLLDLENVSVEDFEHCMKEGVRARNIIIAIKDIHLYPSLYERMIPYLEAKHFGIICITDFGSYDHVLKSHPEFLSHFGVVELEEPTEDEAFKILRNHARLKRLDITNDLLVEILKLTNKFIANQSEPLRSILILEELENLKRKITKEDIENIISDKTNIPIGSLDSKEKEVLLHLEEKMKSLVIGQNEAIYDVVEALKRLRVGISDPEKPAGSFLFLGPTGVGKTYTAKVLAESYFGREDAMIRFDMSEYAMPNSANIFLDKLGAYLEEFPFSLVFFDELEKADKKIHNLLLEVLDEGYVVRENGRKAFFKEAIIIATTNAGSGEIIKDIGISKKYLLEILIQKGIFSPEFLNRFSDVVLFQPLKHSDILKVSRLLIEEVAQRIFIEKGIQIEVTDALIEKVSEAGFDINFGARPIKRAIEEIIENKVADYIISGGGEGNLKIV